MKNWAAFLFFPLACAAQTKGVVRDSLTAEPVPYVNIWIEGQDSGVTADSLGQFAVKTTNADARVVFSAPGYRSETVPLPEVQHFKMAPLKAVSTDENQQQTQTQVLGAYRKGDISLYYGSQGKPWMLARKFEGQPETPFLKTVKLATECHNNNMKFELRVFEIGKSGNPGRDLISEPVIFRVDRGKDEQQIDLSQYRIRMPENGVFVAVCWMLIPQNHKTWYDHRPMAYWDFDPGIGAMPSDTNDTWAYTLGRWQLVPAKPRDYSIRKFRGKFTTLALSLTLTN